MAHFAADERHALAKTLRSVAPNSATLCGDWSAAQLAAHIVLRERSVVELLGRLPSKRLQRIAQREVDDLAAKQPYEQLIAVIDGGPSWSTAKWPDPTALVWSVPAVRERANLLEYLTHNEDVRRAQPEWEPRALSASVQSAVWRHLPGLTRLTTRRLPIRFALRAPGHGEVVTGRGQGDPAASVTGDPVELVLFAFGRQSVAKVDYEGSEPDVARLRGARLGL